MKNKLIVGKNKNITSWVLLALVLLAATPAIAKTNVGQVSYARGAVTAQHAEYGTRILGKSAAIYEADVIQTAARSFAVIKMSDGTKITVRPNSQLGIAKYISRNGKSGSAILNLFKGGIRAFTGFISKSRNDAYKINTPVATIGIRGTEFDARLCSDDCAVDEKTQKLTKPVKADFVVGRVAFLKGKISATDKQKKTRQLFTGGPIYEGDLLKTGFSSFAVLAFNDKSRVTLRESSDFEIKKHHYNEEKPETNSSLMVLLRGGFRAVTGLIGKFNKKSYNVRTPVATIGIRGTGYEAHCQGDCVSQSAQSVITPLEKILNAVMKPAYAVDESGMFFSVWLGGIDINNDSGTHGLDAGQVAFVSGMAAAPVPQTILPLPIRLSPAPKPDEVEIDANLFSVNEQKQPEAGLYVTVYDGHVALTNNNAVIDLGKGEAAFTGRNAQQQITAPVRLRNLPAFQINDAYPRPEAVNESWETLFNDVTNTDENQDLECVPQ